MEISIKKTVKCEDSLIRQIVLTGLSSKTDDPINLGVMGPTSEGKTYPVNRINAVFSGPRCDEYWKYVTKSIDTSKRNSC